MDNINDMKIKLKELEALLVSHDWYYAMSDDNRYYKQGRKSYELIWKLMDELKDGGYFTEAENLYDTYSK
tara:strand:- start:30 stop:239 length:210 start_codon:yes stop_codon:yes gene_type:complete